MDAPKRFRKRPVVIEAIQVTGDNHDALISFLRGTARGFAVAISFDSVLVKTPEGDMRAQIGDWVIRGVQGEFYPCKPDIFEQTYEEVLEGV